MAEQRPGAIYRPATTETYDRIAAFQRENQISWNAAVNMLVVRGLRAVDAEAAPPARTPRPRSSR